VRDDLLLGEWACLGILCQGPAHGFAVAARLKPDGDVGRVWSMSRALTYRALEQLARRGYVQATAEERGIAGGTRTVLSATRSGRAAMRRWLAAPVPHLRDLRSELLLKLVLCDVCAVNPRPMLLQQHDHVASMVAAFDAAPADDAVALWRRESSRAALRVIEQLLG
jgi:PadR family transcriptional regulator AphA